MDDIDSSDGAAAARAGEIGSIGVSTPWKPIQLVFKRYLPQNGSASKVHVAVKKPVSIALLISSLDASTQALFLCDIFCIGDSENKSKTWQVCMLVY